MIETLRPEPSELFSIEAYIRLLGNYTTILTIDNIILSLRQDKLVEHEVLTAIDNLMNKQNEKK